MFESSESTAALDLALAKVIGEIGSATKDAKNPHFKSRYADYASVWAVAQPALKREEINLNIFPYDSIDGRLRVLIRLAHKGEWMRCLFSVPVTKQDPQGYGSALTYVRRYVLQSVLCIPAEDDDGEAASGRGKGSLPMGQPLGPLVPPPHVFPKSSGEIVNESVIGGLEKQIADMRGRATDLVALDKAIADASGDVVKLRKIAVNLAGRKAKDEVK